MFGESVKMVIKNYVSHTLNLSHIINHPMPRNVSISYFKNKKQQNPYD